jgi:hypothetical protein
MRIIYLSFILGLLGPLVAGCSGSTTVSEYAGMPRYLLPKDHQEYRPLHTASAQGSSAGNPEKSTGGLSLDKSFAEEDARLRKVTKICRDCTSIVGASPSVSNSASKLAQGAPTVDPVKN